MFFKKIVFILISILFILEGSAFSESMQKIENKVSKSIDKEIETQKISEKWHIEKKDLQYNYEVLASKDKVLTENIEKLNSILSLEKKKKNEFLRKEKEVRRIENELDQLLSGILSNLEIFIQKDLPFHREERLSRIDKIKKDMLVEDSDSAEKFRQVFEVLQTEVDFGKTVEVYRKNIAINGTDKIADILRVGRVSLFYLTPDKKSGGKYNPLEKKWVEASNDIKKEIEKGILTAKGERTAELVKLPFGRIVR